MPYVDLSLYGADWALVLLRASVAAVFITHGLMKRGLWKAAPSESIPSSQLQLMRALSVIEPLAGLGVLLGVFSFASSLTLALIMLGAMYFKIFAWKKKFSEPGGWEFDLVLLAVALLLAAVGPGVFSLALP